MDWTFLTPVIAGIVYNLAGWIKSSLEDGEISKYEWGQLFSTTLNMIVIAVAAQLGFGLDPLAASGIAALGTKVQSTVRG